MKKRKKVKVTVNLNEAIKNYRNKAGPLSKFVLAFAAGVGLAAMSTIWIYGHFGFNFFFIEGIRDKTSHFDHFDDVLLIVNVEIKEWCRQLRPLFNF